MQFYPVWQLFPQIAFMYLPKYCILPLMNPPLPDIYKPIYLQT